MLKPRFLTLVGVVFAAAVTRLVPHPPNVTPIAAMALFGGAYFSSRAATFMVPLAAMYLSDLVLGLFVYDFGWFHAAMPFVYGSFALTVCLGLWIRGRRSPLRIGSAALISSTLFFLITNLGVWVTGSLYPMTLEGLVACYAAAIPFFRNILVGDMIYTVTLFGGFALLQQHFSALREEPSPATMRT